jgi:hypothetical protein
MLAARAAKKTAKKERVPKNALSSNEIKPLGSATGLSARAEPTY